MAKHDAGSQSNQCVIRPDQCVTLEQGLYIQFAVFRDCVSRFVEMYILI